MDRMGRSWDRFTRLWCAIGATRQVDLRHFTSPIAARNLQNDLPDEVVSTLLEVCQRNASLYQRYFRLKARLAGYGTPAPL